MAENIIVQLPIGVSDFKELIEYRDPQGEGYLYVDKSLFIKEVLYDGSKVIVITRPRRFGKTMNLSALQYFYADEVEGKPTADLFKGLEISKYPECMKYQGKHPVIFISLKDVKADNYDECLEMMKFIMSETYKFFREQLYSSKIPEDERDYIDLIIKGEPSKTKLSVSLKKLLGFLCTYYGVKPVILIDEYDTPIQKGYTKGYYEKIIDFLRAFLSGALKDKSNLEKGILTGILRVSKESLFSDLNNVEVYSILSKNYSKHFGFTKEEVSGLLEKAELPKSLDQTKEWYNGYSFGDQLVYNPWSILKFIKSRGELKAYWINTSGNDLIRKMLIKSDAGTQDKISWLLSGGSIKEIVDEHIVFRDLSKNRAAIWALFLMSGYLKVLNSDSTIDGEICELAIPNKEIESLYRQISRDWLAGDRGIIWYQELLEDLTSGSVGEFELKMQDAMHEMVSYHDANKRTQETFYHGVMLGIVAGLKDTHEIKSNRESGRGRYDLIIIPKDVSKLGIVMEFKSVVDDIDLDTAANTAYEQINKSKYNTELKQRGIKNICQMGVAFSGKEIRIMGKLLNE